MGSFESLQNTTSFTLQCRRLITSSCCVGAPVGGSRPATRLLPSSPADSLCSTRRSGCDAGDVGRPCDLLRCSAWPVMSWSYGSSPPLCAPIPLSPPHAVVLSGAKPFLLLSGSPPPTITAFTTLLLPPLILRRLLTQIRPRSAMTGPRGRRPFNGTGCNNMSVIVLHCSSITEAPGSIRSSGVFL